MLIDRMQPTRTFPRPRIVPTGMYGLSLSRRQTMKLFYAPPSPFARKVRIVARERGLMGQIEEVAVNPLQNDPRLLAINPAGLVPAMILSDGTPLIDSPLIAEYMDQAGSGERLIPTDGLGRWHVLRHAALADTLMDFAVQARYEMIRPDTTSPNDFLARRLAKVERCVESLPKHNDANPQSVNMGDIATVCALSYLDFRFPDLDWRAKRPDLVDWHAVIEARPAFVETSPIEHIS